MFSVKLHGSFHEASANSMKAFHAFTPRSHLLIVHRPTQSGPITNGIYQKRIEESKQRKGLRRCLHFSYRSMFFKTKFKVGANSVVDRCPHTARVATWLKNKQSHATQFRRLKIGFSAVGQDAARPTIAVRPCEHWVLCNWPRCCTMNTCRTRKQQSGLTKISCIASIIL